ncbi:MAG: pilus assembly protein CpaF [Candidatus Aquicultor secundus]|nr:MAG: pilus assembly protein CpaF [Candidatus Aquicultor secundus]
MNKRIHHQLIEALGPELYDRATSSDELKIKVENRLKDLISVEPTQLSPAEKKRLIDEITNDVLGYGPLDQFLRDPEVTEIMINGAETIYIERFGKIELSKEKFLDDMHLRRIIDKIVAQVGRRIDESVPMVDARLQDGSRVNAIIPPLAIGGPKLTIRKFSADPFKVEDLINFGTITPKVAMFIEACVRGRLNVIVSGGTGSGKTTTLNVLSSFIPTDERILTIEDAVELQLRQDHVIQLESRPANIEGKGEVAIRDLVRNALRMRPDRIVVGEVRGGEALDMLQAMNTGHDGSLSTVHANAPRDVLSRLETMVLMSGMELPIKAIREQCSSAIDLIIQQARLRDGTRRITHITEVQGMEGDIITLQDLFLFDFSMGLDESGKFKGKLKSTGIRPKFTQRLQDQGISLPAEVFQFEYIGRGMAS